MIESAPAASRPSAVLRSLSVPRAARTGLLVLNIKLISAGLALALQLALARTLGQAGYGEYTYVVAWLQLMLVFSNGGFATAALRYVSEYRARNQSALMRGFLIRSKQIALLESLVLALLMVGCAVAFCRSDSQHSIANFLIASVALPFMSYFILSSEIVRGLGHVVQSMLASLVQPALLVGALLVLPILIRLQISSGGALLLNLGAAAGALGVISALRRRHEQAFGNGSECTFLTHEWLRTATLMVVSSSLMYLQGRTGVIISGLLLDTRATGAYAVVERLADVALLGLLSVNMLIAPKFAALYAQRRLRELRRHARLAAWGATGFMLATIVPLILFGRPILRLFGDDFVSAYPALLALLAGVAVNAMCGSVGFLLSMTGHQRDAVHVAFFSLCLNLILSFALIPRYGVMGTAVANAVSMAVWNISMVVVAARRLGIWACVGRNR